MQTSVPRAAAALAIALLAPWGAAHAQLGNLGGLGSSLPGQSLTSNSLGNVTGLLQFCIKNNYLNADSASGVKDSLLGKLPGGANTTDSGYTQGSNGILTAGNGSQLNLSGGGLKEAATRQVCDKVLNQAKSML